MFLWLKVNAKWHTRCFKFRRGNHALSFLFSIGTFDKDILCFPKEEKSMRYSKKKKNVFIT